MMFEVHSLYSGMFLDNTYFNQSCVLGCVVNTEVHIWGCMEFLNMLVN